MSDIEVLSNKADVEEFLERVQGYYLRLASIKNEDKGESNQKNK